MIVHTERHPAHYDYRTRFRGLRTAGGAEGATLYSAEEAGAPVLITDESTLFDMLGETGDAIAIHHFAHREARDLYLATLLPDADFKVREQWRQATFKHTLSPAAQALDEHSRRHPFLLALGAEDENLFPSLRGPRGARAYFVERGIHWWTSPRSGDAPKHRAPTRNMTSSQVACVNLFMPLLHEPALLTAMMRSIDADIVDVGPVPYTTPGGAPASSLIELEWTGCEGTLEGHGSRGSRATSADACLVGITATGARRLFLVECKYTERYTTRGGWKGDGASGDARRTRYAPLYGAPSSCLSGIAPLDEVLYDPIYQIVRLGMLADAARVDGAMGVTDARVVIVCPGENVAYGDRITSPPLARRFPEATTVDQLAKRLWRDPDGVSMVDPRRLVNAVRDVGAGALSAWSTYLRDRYGW